jgi:hypothetical protein
MSFLRPSQRKISKLRQAIAVSNAKANLYDMPERIAALIEDFESRDVHPAYREDVYRMLNSVIEVCRIVINPSYAARPAIEQIGELMQMLPRMLLHLTDRPTTAGWAIELDHKLLPQVYSTQEEANTHVGHWRRAGTGARVVVVPVQITSQHVSSPGPMGKPAPDIPVLCTGDIPEGIKPAPRLTFDDLMERVTKAEAEGGDISRAVQAPGRPREPAQGALQGAGESPPTGRPGPGTANPPPIGALAGGRRDE